jgi:hypothetical protein
MGAPRGWDPDGARASLPVIEVYARGIARQQDVPTSRTVGYGEQEGEASGRSPWTSNPLSAR